MRTGSWILMAAVGLLLSVQASAEEGSSAAGPPPSVELPPVTVSPPRVEGGAPDAPVVTARTPLRTDLSAFDVPAAVTLIGRDELIRRRMARSLPDALLRLPGVMVQKTAPLQSSPFLRGFTGYHTLLLVDGIRLNHSAMRAGPNQYWSTVDPFTIQRLEVVRGPHSVLYGSDAVGGTVNAIPLRQESFARGWHPHGAFTVRGSTGENALFFRTTLHGNADNVGFWGGVSHKTYGDIESGGGRLPGTGGIREIDADWRFDVRLSRTLDLTFAFQHVDQEDAPRTESTVFARPFRGSDVGTDLRRDLDQERDLVYARLAYDARGACRPIERGTFTLSWHRHEEVQDRLRTMGRQDLQGFELDQLGVSLQLESRTGLGRFVYGVDYTHDLVDSFRRNFVNGMPTLTEIQGPVGDDATYDLLGLYVEDRIALGRWELIPGIRFTYAAADADRVDDPAVAGADPATPGNVIGISDEWTNLVGSLRIVYHASRSWNLYASASQAFRAPSLSDLTALDSTSVVETPAPGLEPEDYVSFELGSKVETPTLKAGAAVWTTILEDTIVRSPTGVLIGGVPEVRKDNVGDGWLWGIEGECAWRFCPSWTLFGNAGWMDGEADEVDPATGALVRSPVSRMRPFSYLAGLRYEPSRGRLWVQADVNGSAREDRLSLRDRTDTRRIPPGGTPSWATLNLRSGVRLDDGVHLSVALENLLDEDYRIHGSGVNEPGRSLVVGLDVEF